MLKPAGQAKILERCGVPLIPERIDAFNERLELQEPNWKNMSLRDLRRLVDPSREWI